MRIHRRNDGFTLVELMIVVALIGVLAAIAIPSFLSYQARSRRTEAFTNLSALARTQKTLQATKGAYHDSGLPFPDSLPYGGLGAHKMDWDAASEAAFGELGWAPAEDFEGGLRRTVRWYLDNGRWLERVGRAYRRERLGLAR